MMNVFIHSRLSKLSPTPTPKQLPNYHLPLEHTIRALTCLNDRHPVPQDGAVRLHSVSFAVSLDPSILALPFLASIDVELGDKDLEECVCEDRGTQLEMGPKLLVVDRTAGSVDVDVDAGVEVGVDVQSPGPDYSYVASVAASVDLTEVEVVARVGLDGNDVAIDDRTV